VDQVLTVDVHSRRAAACFPTPLRSLSAARLFTEVLARDDMRDLTVVAPDEGALDRCQAVRRAAGIDAPLAYMRKERGVDGVTP
jgi:ribose-phosphate pyrophosphokinase